jgi:cellulose biosynthesis protein BcsQ
MSLMIQMQRFIESGLKKRRGVNDMLISFWSPNHGQTGTTSTTIAMATIIALVHNFKILVAHSLYERSTLERCYIKNRTHIQEDLLEINDNGLDALKRLARNGRLTPDMISNYTTSLLTNRRLDLLQGVDEHQLLKASEDTTLLRQIFNSAKQAYDLVFIDVHSGLSKALTHHIIEDSDLVIVCLNQNMNLLEDYTKEPAYKVLLQNKIVIHSVGLYNGESKYTMKNIKKRYGFDHVMNFPYNIGFQDACNNSQILDFFMRHTSRNPKGRHFKTMEALFKGAELMIELLENKPQEVTNELS